MKTALLITVAKIDEPALIAERKHSCGIGAVITFLGTVREMEDRRKIEGIHYEAFQKMAEHQFQLIFKEIENRWPVESIRLVHRIGFVAAGEPSLWVEITAPHRGEAFAACQYLIDEMKKRVPIWKRMNEGPTIG
jgi:molybdopterin synthase catalytic subunit